MIYLDNNATTRVDPSVVEAMMPYWSTAYLNPASVAGDLYGASAPLHEAKKALVSLLGGAQDEYVLTSGATEANNWVLQATVARSLRETGKCHLIISAIEHPSVLETAQALQEWNSGVRLDLIPVDEHGVVKLDSLKALVTVDTTLVSIMLANNETGVIQPVGEAAHAVKEINSGCLFHTDATQAAGKIPVDLNEDLAAVDFLSLSAHKFHGPKGVGGLFIRTGSPLDSWMHGGTQQNGRRAGTENPVMAIGLAKAIAFISNKARLHEQAEKIRTLRDNLESSLIALNSGIRVLGSLAPRLPNTSLLLLPGIEGEMLVHQLLDAEIATSTGSACSNGSDRPSHVVTCMGVSFSDARNVLRLSLSRLTSTEDAESLISTLASLLSFPAVR